jgi:hypothetical protein
MKKKVFCGICGFFIIALVGITLIIILTQPPLAKEFQNPQKVTILGYNQDTMEPFISTDGQYLFFNSLNDGQNTSLLYAEAIDTTTFQFKGEIKGVNTLPPHLDAVASMDDANNLYFITTRDYPDNYHNLMTGVFEDGVVVNLTRVEGDFYIEESGWLIMDAEISRDGNTLFVVNAQFTGGALPKKADIRIAHKVDGEFVLDANSDSLMGEINTASLEYAPASSQDGLMLMFTRIFIIQTQILVSTRTSTTDPFGTPRRLDLSGLIEAPTITLDGSKVYYHQKTGTIYEIYMMDIVGE